MGLPHGAAALPLFAPPDDETRRCTGTSMIRDTGKVTRGCLMVLSSLSGVRLLADGKLTKSFFNTKLPPGAPELCLSCRQVWLYVGL